MKKFAFKKIDAFATEKSDGNPAGYIHLESWKDITEEEMLAIAKELKGYVNEVGFVVETSELLEFKYYSSEQEVDFCGHATIGILYDLLNNNNFLQERASFKIKTNHGILAAENRLASENAVFVMAPTPEEKAVAVSKDEVAQCLSIDSRVIDTDYSFSIINAGLNTLLVPIKDLNSILSIDPDFITLKKFCENNNVHLVEVFSKDTVGAENDYRTRVFPPVFGYIEDPATGSGNSAFGYYLIKNNLFSKDTITIEQNGKRDNFNIVKLQKKMDENGRERIFFGGSAIARINGEYFL